ncbi:hypothetical protein [Actinoplanes sp. NPDC020271]|uniref:hypothetical protein n=1 Tax=Actinoplanes sp. NPDC020271 TaxID=3363896 RepID=UPI0037A6339D
MPKARLAAAVVVATTSVLATAGITAPAAAAPAAAVGKIAKYDRSVLRPSSSVTGNLRKKLETAKTDYLDFAARHGRSLDARGVSAFTDPASKVVLAVGEGTVIDKVNVGTVDGKARGVGVESHEAGNTSTAQAPVMGFAGDPTTDGYKMVAANSHIVTVADDADVQPTSHYTNYVKSWFWKYELPEGSEVNAFSSTERSGSDFFVYARRGDANPGGANADLYSSVMDDLTIRARPWGGTSGNFKKMISRLPVSTTNSCTSSGSLEVSAGPYSVEIPQNNCSNVTGLTSTSSPYEFGADWNGKTQGAVSIEAIASFKVAEGKVPSFADYIWMNFYTVTAGYPVGTVKWTDTGW